MTPRLDDPAEITRWLDQLRGDDAPAAAPQTVDALFGALYRELRRCARAQMRREYDGHTLSATALLHEAWFRMGGQERTAWRNRSHFLGVAALMMRRILINHAQAKRAAKREAALTSLTAVELDGSAAVLPPAEDLLAVHEALDAFAQVDARAARVVELKFFGGLENEEVAEVLDLSVATVKRDWALARAWLHRALEG